MTSFIKPQVPSSDFNQVRFEGDKFVQYRREFMIVFEEKPQKYTLITFQMSPMHCPDVDATQTQAHIISTYVVINNKRAYC